MSELRDAQPAPRVRYRGAAARDRVNQALTRREEGQAQLDAAELTDALTTMTSQVCRVFEDYNAFYSTEALVPVGENISAQGGVLDPVVTAPGCSL